MTPPPRFASARPASNWGFTSAITQPPGASSAATGGNTRRSEMNDTSITAASTSSGNAVSVRMLVRSIVITRGSVRSDQASWP